MSNSTDSDIVAVELLLVLERVEYSSELFSSVSYGLYLAFSGMTLFVLLAKRNTYLAQRWTMVYMALMFIVTTIWYMTGAKVSASFFIDDTSTSEALELTTKVCAILQYLLSDFVLVFRMYLSWNRSLVITLIPALLYLLSAVSGVIAELYTVNEWAESVSAAVRLIFLSTTVVLNTLVTCMIAFKVLAIMRAAPRLVHGALGLEVRARATFIIIVESGALYSVVGVIWLVFFRSDQTFVIMLSSTFQVLSFLNPAFMILRLVMGISQEYYEASLPPAIDNEKGSPPLPS